MSALNMGRVGTPIPQENLGCFLFVSPLNQYSATPNFFIFNWSAATITC
ncbi:MAG: hypothetical protein V7K50_22275 [Nostoc sp.]